MDIKNALLEAAKILDKNKIKFPHLEAEILLSHIIRKNREFLFTYPQKKITENQLLKFKKNISQRVKGVPIAYLTGCKEFYGFNFVVNEHTLVPRPETELMVEEALKIINKSSVGSTILDIGTGSGCIIITLAKLSENKHDFYGLDISTRALKIARKNAKLNNTTIRFIKGDLLKPILSSGIINDASEIIITANLPYGWSAWKNNSSADTIGLKFEPEIALFTGKNGLELYEKLLIQLKVLSEKNKNFTAFLEIDPRQTDEIKKIIKQYLPSTKTEIKKDLSGHNRLVVIKL